MTCFSELVTGGDYVVKNTSNKSPAKAAKTKRSVNLFDDQIPDIEL